MQDNLDFLIKMFNFQNMYIVK